MEWIVGALTTILVAGVPGIYKLWRDRGAAQQRAIREAEDRAYEKARAEHLLREAKAVIEQKNREHQTKDALIAEKDATIAEQRRVITTLTHEDPT